MGKSYDIVKTKEELIEKTDAYFAECDDDGTPYTVPGYAYYLGYAGRDAIPRLAKDENYGGIIKRAKLRIETQRNIQLITDGNAPGKIFDLKNNFAWVDQTQVEHSGQLSLTAKILEGRKRAEALDE